MGREYTCRMKQARRFLIGVLVFLLPLYGQAAVDFSCHCTMHTAVTTHQSSMQTMSGHGMDCCHPHALEKHAPLDKSGSSGQCGHGCNGCDGCSAYQPLAFLMLFPSLPALKFGQVYMAVVSPACTLRAVCAHACARLPMESDDALSLDCAFSHGFVLGRPG